MKRWLANIYRQAASGELPLTESKWAKQLLDMVHVSIIVVQQTAQDRLHVRSATLSYWTAVSIVPLLVLAFALTGPLGLQAATVETLRELLYERVLVQGVDEVGTTLDSLLLAVDLGTVGLFGVLGLMFISSQIYFHAELAYNDVFSCRLHRGWIVRFLIFNATILMGPILIAAGMVLSAQLPTTVTAWAHLLPIMMTALALSGAIKLLPNTPVRWRSALVGGLVSAAMFEAAKWGFGAYTELLGTKDNMTRLFGSVAFLPVFLLWLNVLWMVVLMGVELAYVTENRSQLLDVQRELAADPHAHRRHPDGLFAVGVLVALTQVASDGTATEAQIAQTAGVPRHHVATALEVLEDAGVVTREDNSRWKSAHPPYEITAGEVLRAWHGLATPRWQGHHDSRSLVARMQLRLEQSANMDLATLATMGDD